MIEHRERIRWSDVDSYGHVNNAVYVTYLEVARQAKGVFGLIRVVQDGEGQAAHVGVMRRHQAFDVGGQEVACQWDCGRLRFMVGHSARLDARAEGLLQIVSFDCISNILGSLGFPVEVSGFGGVSVRTHAHTPKSGVPPRQFLKSQNNSSMIASPTW